jgi:hypothetical protein
MIYYLIASLIYSMGFFGTYVLWDNFLPFIKALKYDCIVLGWFYPRWGITLWVSKLGFEFALPYTYQVGFPSYVVKAELGKSRVTYIKSLILFFLA